MGAVTQCDLAVDDDEIDARGLLFGFVVGSGVGNGRGVEQDQVGELAIGDAAPVNEPESVTGQAGHAPHGLGQFEHTLLAHVVTKHLGEGTEQPWMWLASKVSDAVGADHHQWVPQVLFDVCVVDNELDAQCAIAVRCTDDIVDELRDGYAKVGGDIDRHTTFVLAERRAARESNDLGKLWVDLVQIEVLRHRPASCGIGIDVERDVGPLRIGLVDLGERQADLAPVSPPGRLVVRDLDGQVSCGANLDCLVDGVEQPVAFVAHMGGVDSAGLG